MNTLKPVLVETTGNGIRAEFSRSDVEKFLEHYYDGRFQVEGVPVSASTELIREVLFSEVGTSPT